ncbi:MAG: VOC family protein [Deltaproteobacteria bacterium]|nr:VOC family protein [Deltaproteobacteria bacterium]
MQNGHGQYNVGGVLLPRPFKVRRLGHFGFNLAQLEEGVRFYTQLLGFRLTDELNLSKIPELQKMLAGLQDPRLFFTSHGSDHHALLLAHKSLGAIFGDDAGSPDVTINQITWQLGTLEEVVNAYQFFKEKGIEIRRVGRDMPGSNWHVYIRDPDGHTIELYYGIEQVGWTRHSKPMAMYYRRFDQAPSLPQMSEAMEIEDALQKKIDITSGHRPTEDLPNTYNVGGVLLPRPFKVTRIGPVGLFVQDVSRAEAFYTEMLGFVKTEEVNFKGRRCVFLRNGTEHHSLGLFSRELRQELGLSAHTTCMTFGAEVGSYEQLRSAVHFFQEKGARLVEGIPPELHPGIDYAAHVQDPDGHCIQLYYYMEQVGWDGKPRPKEQRRVVKGEWPEALEPLSDTYVDQTFQGPLG